MESNQDTFQDTLLKIEDILSCYSLNGKLIFGKTQLVFACLTCPVTGNWNEHLQDLDYTLKIAWKIIIDPIKAKDYNHYFCQIYSKCINNNENKQNIVEDLISQNLIISNQQQKQMTATLDSVQILIDSYQTSLRNKKFSLLVILSSLLSRDLNQACLAEKLFIYNQQLNQMKLKVADISQAQQRNRVDPQIMRNNYLSSDEFPYNNKIQQENKQVELQYQQNQRNLFQQPVMQNIQKIIYQNEKEFKKPNEANNIQQYPKNIDSKSSDDDNQLKKQQNFAKFQPNNQKDFIIYQDQIQQQIDNDQNINKLKKQLYQNIQDSQLNQQVEIKKQFSEQIKNNNLQQQFPINQMNQEEINYFHQQQQQLNLIDNRQISIQNQQKFYSEEVDSILKKIKDLTIQEKELFMKLFGKFHDGMNGQFLDDLKKRYPEIYYLIQSSKALEKVTKMKPRSVQIISCLLFLYKQKQKGRILQINTGEGKSITVAMIAATRCLMKDKVDIFTSNSELAKRDCEEFQNFYKELGLTCGLICREKHRSIGRNENYLNDVIYGDVGSYAAELLDDQYEQAGTRCGRQFEFALVDEVDCMFIDQHNCSTSLLKSIPGLHKLNTILWLIWYKITQMRDQYLDGYYYFVENEDKKYCCRAEDFIREFIKQNLMSGLLATKFDEYIPSYMKKFAKSWIKIWIKNGFKAIHFERNKQYKVQNDKIIPIDYMNTGTAQLKSMWSGGLHQFIQMKENVTVTPIKMTVNFVSHVYIFLQYKCNLIGLTGTLGSFKSIDILQQFYKVDTLKVPPFKPSKLQKLPPLIENTTQDFQRTILSQIGEQMNKGRPCLIISESEKFSKHLSKVISKKFQKIKIIEYYSGDESIDKECINDCCVILSTNLAGRGTDIKLSSQVINNGGLHVIVTFTPKNKRVEDQAFGRAGRCGQDGSAQMVIDGEKDSFIIDYKVQQNQNLIEIRDMVDAQICERQLQNMKDISKMDEIFWDYCKTLNTCEILKNKQYLRKQEEEIWATFYCMIQIKRTKIEKVVKKFRIFKEEFQKRVNERKIVNFSYLINEGFKQLIDGKFTQAIQISEEIILRNSNSLAAHYIKAAALFSLKKYDKSIEILGKCEEILQQKNSLHQALQIIQLQSQSLVQQEYNQELYEQSILSSKQYMSQAQESLLFNKNKYDRMQLESYITQSGCFKRIKDEELIRGKIQEQIRDLKSKIKTQQKKQYWNGGYLYFIRIDKFFENENISKQILDEYQFDEFPLIASFNQKNPLQWKSLIPLACGIFQLSNSLYFMQGQIIQSEGNNSQNQKIIKIIPKIQNQCENNNLIKYIEEQDKQVQGIANAIQKIITIEGLNLKEYMSQESILLIHHIRKFQVQDYAHMLTQINDEQASKIQKELIIKISFKDALTKEIVKFSQQVAYIAQKMAQDQKFLSISQLQTKFQQICNNILEQTKQFQLVNKNQIDMIYKAFKQQFQYLGFNRYQYQFASDFNSNLKQDYKNLILQNIENSIKGNNESLLSSNYFFDIILNIMRDPLQNAINLTIQNIQTIVFNDIRSLLIKETQQEINSLNKQLEDYLLKIQKQQRNNNKESSHYIYIKNKIINYEKFVTQLEQGEEIIQQFINNLNQAISRFKIDFNDTFFLLNDQLKKDKIKNFLLNNNQFLDQDRYVLIQQTLLGIRECYDYQHSINYIQSEIVKKIQVKILIPVFKNASHVFEKQIESNAICGLFSNIIE